MFRTAHQVVLGRSKHGAQYGRGTWHVWGRRETRGILVRQPEGTCILGRPRITQKDNIKMALNKQEGRVGWINPAQGLGSCKHGKQPPVSRNARNFLTRSGTV